MRARAPRVHGDAEGQSPYCRRAVLLARASSPRSALRSSGRPPFLGTAKGTATASGFTAVVKTTKTTATETSGFSWTRVGVVAVITTSGTKITFGNGQVATAAAPGAGLGTFAPLNFSPTKNKC